MKRYVYLFVLLLSLATCYAAAEQFTKYDTDITILDDETLFVQKKVHIRNTHDAGIIPGQFEFKLYHETGEITSYNVVDRYERKIPSELRRTDNASVILLNIYQPILPGFEYVVHLEYYLTYDEKGLLFSSLKVPVREETRIPLKEGTVQVHLPEGKHFTFMNPVAEGMSVEGNSFTWAFNETAPYVMEFEYSRVPIRYGDWRGSLLFWGAVNVVLWIGLIFEITRRLRARKEEMEEDHRRTRRK